MGSTSVGNEQTRTTLVVAIDEVGKGIVLYGLVLILVWIDGMKFTSYLLAVGFSCREVRTRSCSSRLRSSHIGIYRRTRTTRARAS